MVGVIVVPGWVTGEVGWGWVGSGEWCRVSLLARATLAGVPAKMVRDRADSDGFPANAAVVAAGVAVAGRDGGPAGVNAWLPC